MKNLTLRSHSGHHQNRTKFSEGAHSSFIDSCPSALGVAAIVLHSLYTVSTMSSVNLEELKKEVEALANKVKDLKAGSAADKDAVGAAVQEMLAAKQKYADNNDGIGVDGKPYEPTMTKAEKKAKSKAEKGPAKAVSVVLL